MQNAQTIDLAELVAHVCADADFEASASGRVVELVETQSAQVRGDAALLRSAIENVVRNALLHAPESNVEVGLQTRATEAIVRVRDWGPGVPESALDELFDPFFRVASGARPAKRRHWFGPLNHSARPGFARRQRARPQRGGRRDWKSRCVCRWPCEALALSGR